MGRNNGSRLNNILLNAVMHPLPMEYVQSALKNIMASISRRNPNKSKLRWSAQSSSRDTMQRTNACISTIRNILKTFLPKYGTTRSADIRKTAKVDKWTTRDITAVWELPLQKPSKCRKRSTSCFRRWKRNLLRNGLMCNTLRRHEPFRDAVPVATDIRCQGMDRDTLVKFRLISSSSQRYRSSRLAAE